MMDLKGFTIELKCFLDSTFYSLLNVNNEFKSYGSWYESYHDDKLDACIHSPHSHINFVESWNQDS